MEKEMQKIDDFRENEYIHDFEIKNNILASEETDEAFNPDEIKIERTGRYVSESNPDEISILYAITTKSGTKGILTDAYGKYADERITEFIKNVPVDKKPQPS